MFESFEGKFVYYGGPDERIWKVPAAGGEETPVLEKSRRALWTLSESGIYILDPDAKGGPEIDFFRFTTGERMQILKLPGEPDEHVWGSGTLAVSPDQRWILYERRDRHEADIMLVENFR